MQRAKPNLFIVGGMKCGTSILYDFLCEDPRICGARGKEVHYFTLHEDRGEAWYLDHFKPGKDYRYYLDASPTYLDMADRMDIPSKIKAFEPDAKIIILIRDPIDRIISHFSHYRKVNKFAEVQKMTIQQFADALLDAPTGQNNLVDLAREFSFFKKKIDLYSDVFGSQNVFLIHNMDLRDQGAVVMAELYDFLGLSPMEGRSYSEQRYLNDSKKSVLRPDQLISLSELYGQDYYESCRAKNVTKPDLGEAATAPVGAIVDSVLVGRDGWLFLAGGPNSPIHMYDAEQSAALVQKWHGLTRQRITHCQSLGARYMHMMIPEKLSIFPDLAGLDLPIEHGQGNLFSISPPPDLAGHLIRLFDLFRKSPLRDRLYFRSDSHWSHVGAFLAYQQICAILGVQSRPELLSRPASHGDILFDLGGKLPDRPKERATFVNFVSEAHQVYSNSIVDYKVTHDRENDAGLHVGSHVRFRNETAPVRQCIMLFGDSFSEYRTHLITGLLAETFYEVDFIWSTSLDFSMIADRRPDVVLLAMTERFMSRLPDDSFNVADYATALMKEISV